MSQWFLYFLFYSLAGCGLEKLYARAIRSPGGSASAFCCCPCARCMGWP